MSGRVLAALAVADFRERTRRPAYLVTLAAAVALGYLALPPADSLWVIMDVGGYRGFYNSAYAGTATALAGALWLMLGGFYVVCGAIARDQHTGVGQLLATTPLTRVGYLTGKFCSNLLVLASMAGALAVTALVLQLARGESRAIDPVTLLTPFILLTLPVLALTAAAAVLFETIPGLRAGLGNVAWFFLWMIFAIAGGGAPLGGLGPVAASMREALAAQHLPVTAEFSVGFTKVDEPMNVFGWHGLEPTGGFVAGRLVLILVVAGVAALPAMWFGRFDPARGGPAPAPLPVPVGAPVPASVPATPRMCVHTLLSPVDTRRQYATGRLLAGEFRILVQGVFRWWWLVVAAVTVAGIAVPARMEESSGASAVLLSAAWIWPILIWSRLGTQCRENGLEVLLGAYPMVHRRLVAEWGAGVVLTAVTGAGPLLGLALAGDGPGVAAWAAGAVFIPSLALMLGTVTRTHRTFQAGYVILWYAVVNQVAAADFMGVVRVNGHPAGPPPVLVAGVSLGLFAVAFIVRLARYAHR